MRTLPYLEVVGSLRGTNETGFTGNWHDWNLGLQLTWSLYDRGLRYPLADELASLARAHSLAS